MYCQIPVGAMYTSHQNFFLFLTPSPYSKLLITMEITQPPYCSPILANFLPTLISVDVINTGLG